MKKIITLFSGAALASIFSLSVNAQTSDETPTFRKWSIGLNAGALTTLSPYGGENDFSKKTAELGYGLYAKYQINPYFSVKVDGVKGKLSGDVSEAYKSGKYPTHNIQAFSTDLDYSVYGSLVGNLLSLDLFKKQSAVTLFTSFGAGIVQYKPTITPKNGTATPFQNGEKLNELIIPVGVGAKFRLGNSVNLDLGWTTYFVDADNIDGTWSGKSNDKYNYAYAGLEFALGQGKQLAFSNPVAYSYDEALKAKNLANSMKADLDAQKAENARLRDELNNLLKDSDGDGVADKLDKCPNTPAGTVVDGAGCPLSTPKQIVTEKIIVTEADRKVVDEAIRNLEFDTGKATLREKSYATLNKVAELLVGKNFSLKLAGHTDNTGGRELNLRLSKERAESVKAYLVSQGANASRIEATGYGPDQPIASNKTADGRQKNRRVEFTLY